MDKAKILRDLADVIERAEHDEMVQAFKVLVEIKNENLIAMRNECYTLEKEYAELKANIDKAIKEIRRNAYDYSGSGNEVIQAYCDGFKASLEILKKNIGEQSYD